MTDNSVDPRHVMAEKQLQELHDACTKQINTSIQDFMKAGAMKRTDDISDGYHTFGELYEFRCVLTNALFKQLLDAYEVWYYERRCDGTPYVNPVWKSKLHSDGTMFDNFFIVGYGRKPGEYITFHYPLTAWDLFDYAEVLDKAPEWDGHTPADILERLKVL